MPQISIPGLGTIRKHIRNTPSVTEAITPGPRVGEDAQGSPNSPAFCIRSSIEGESATFTVSVARNERIEGLKVKIQHSCKYGTLRNVDPKDLVLWKVCGSRT
jgi:hypothetical protein